MQCQSASHDCAGPNQRPQWIGTLSGRFGWKADIADFRLQLQFEPVIQVVRTETGLSFPEFEEGSRLHDLARDLAIALGTSARKPTGSPLEILVGFEGYPDGFALWWDGFTCELGCAGSSGLSLDTVTERLVASGLFERG